MSVSLNTLYGAVGISRQAVHRHLERQMRRRELEQQVLMLVHRVRSDHPGMGLREMYFKIRPAGIGRDAFELLCRDEGLCVIRLRNCRRTTDSSGVKRFPNLIKDRQIDRHDQVWQSDITYFELKGRFCYITLIQDAFSKMIVGHWVSDSLRTESTTLPALTMALKRRRGKDLTGLILHSDGGGQYYAERFLKVTQDRGIVNSMCRHPWDNGMAESLNNIVKNRYLAYRTISDMESLRREVDRTVSLYNQDRPHPRLGRVTPLQFEKNLLTYPDRTK